MSNRPGLAPATRLVAVLIAGTFFFDATARSYSEPGLSTFGRPPELAALWAALGVLSLLLIGGARMRLLCARRLTMLVLLVCLFGGRAVDGAPELALSLIGVTLFIAAPLLRPGLAGAVTLAVLVCSLPSVISTPYPQGAVSWLTAFLPPASLAVLLPSLFPGRHIRRAAIVFTIGTALLAAASLSTYVTLANGIHMPLDSLFATRLRPMGMHPNLAVPQLVAALLIACGLAWDPAENRRGWARASAVILAITLGAVQSRTGLAAALMGIGLLVVRRLPFRGARWVQPLAAVGLVVALLFPVTGIGRGSIQNTSSDKTQKAVSFRSAMWQLGLDTFQQSPWHGFGPESTYRQAEFARPSRYDGLPKDDHPHNVVLAVGNAMGWPGLFGLAALLGLSVVRRRSPGLLSDAASATLVVTWASNAVDMGGATTTLHPSLAFLAIGFRQAADQPTDDEGTDDPPAAPFPGAAAVVALGVLLVFAGGCAWSGRWLVEGASDQLEEYRAAGQDSAKPDAGRPPPLPSPVAESLTQDLARAGQLRPFDPGVRLIQARLASHGGSLQQQLEHLAEARRLHPGSARILHETAVVLARIQPEDPEVRDLLEESVRRDPLGPSSWRSLVDLAIVRGGHGDADGALDALVAALVLNPSAIQRVRWNPRTDRLTLGWEGVPGTSIPLSRVLIALARERIDRGEDDPATHMRLQLREIEIYTALGDFARADESCRRILADNDVYRHTRLGTSALLQGDYDRALEELSQLDMSLYFEGRVNGLVAMSEATDLDREAFAALSAQLDANLPDVTFEGETLRRILRARQRVAERLLQPEEALYWSDALRYASR